MLLPGLVLGRVSVLANVEQFRRRDSKLEFIFIWTEINR